MSPYVTPDLIVEKAGEDWIVSLTDGTLPSVRVNSAYAKLLRDGARSKDEIRTYVSKKLGDARWLINAINQRRATMLKVANYIVRAQMDWFEKGPAHLRPMVLQDVAGRSGNARFHDIAGQQRQVHADTTHGVFELKYFFDSKVQRDDGEDVSARSVKEHISVLIDGEDKDKRSPIRKSPTFSVRRPANRQTHGCQVPGSAGHQLAALPQERLLIRQPGD